MPVVKVTIQFDSGETKEFGEGSQWILTAIDGADVVSAMKGDIQILCYMQNRADVAIKHKLEQDLGASRDTMIRPLEEPSMEV